MHTVRYPIPRSQSSEVQLALKIARHHPCSLCPSCVGLHPPDDFKVVLDDESQNGCSLGILGEYGSDDDDDETPIYLDICSCGHSAKEHGADPTLTGAQEFARLGRVASRMDEFLQDAGKLLDFNYTDEAVEGLRAQMASSVSSSIAPVSALFVNQLNSPSFASSASSSASDLSVLDDLTQSPTDHHISEPPRKKQRVDSSSLSSPEAEEGARDYSDDEDEEPLAVRVNRTGARGEKSPKRPPRSGKKAPVLAASKSKGPTKQHPSEPRVKVEEKIGDEQLARLTSGVTVDGAAAPLPAKTEKAASIELRKGIIQITPVENDKQCRSLVILTGLKTLFQKQLPKMPREYIARLVYDSNSKSLAIIKRGYKVVGGICYRPFPHRGFAEIVFFATASVDQVKGYGGMLMDHFKSHIKKTYPDMMHFLTYADNYAVGYFEKQGFSKEITLDRSVWAGYIKDYEGGTIMQCTMLRKVDYLDKATIIRQQQEAVMDKIRQLSRSHIIHPGLPQFQDGASQVVPVDPQDVPGLRESGWTPDMAATLLGAQSKSADRQYMERLLKDLSTHPQAWPFVSPVNGKDVPDYYEIIKNPMDFRTMNEKLETNQYQCVDEVVKDAQLIFDNCLLYNPEGSIYTKNAIKLRKLLDERIKERSKEA